MTHETCETYKPVTVDDLLWFGEEGEHIGCQGHVDLTAFTAAADELSRRDVGLDDDDELPSADGQAAHLWLRPIERGDVKRYSDHESDEDFDRRVFAYIDEGHMVRCEADHPRSSAWTMIPTGV
jgi:hypothetical protein